MSNISILHGHNLDILPTLPAGSRVGDVVLDPFGGSGTVGDVCSRLGRDAVLIELNPEYLKIAQRRVANAPLNLFAVGAD